jgi:hypothetical protein
MYDKVHEIITSLVVVHNIPYTEKVMNLLNNEIDLKKIFETREFYEQLQAHSEGKKFEKSGGKLKI